MPVFRDVKPGDVLRIGNTTIEVGHKTGQRTRLHIDSPDEVNHQKAAAASITRPAAPTATPAPRDAAAPQPTPRLTRPSFVAAG